MPEFEDKTGIDVRVVAVGTGQAIKNAANGDGDVLLVHSKAAEEQFMADGLGIARFDLMYNDFVIVGPSTDPAQVKGADDVLHALARIADSGSIFFSRGDDSGTNAAELRFWAETGIDVEVASGKWYRETGAGMGATLNAGIGMDAYILTDRSTWVAFGNKARHEVMVEGDARLFNQYGIILVNPERYPNVHAADAKAFVDWLIGAEGQAAIGAYEVDGQQLFFPNASAHR